MVEGDAFQLSKLSGIASLGAVADADALDVDVAGQLLGNLREDLRECCRGLDVEPELALFANESQYHDAILSHSGLCGCRGSQDSNVGARRFVVLGRRS